MRKLTGSDLTLRWAQPQAQERIFELRSDDDLVATLAWEKMFGTLATAQTADKTWTFKRVGFFNPRVTVRSPNSDADLAVFKPSWGYGGTLDIGSRAYAWKRVDFWGNKWGFFGPEGTALLTFSYAGGPGTLFKLEGQVEIAPGSVATNPDVPKLVTLGWYIMVMMHDDNAAAVVAATSV